MAVKADDGEDGRCMLIVLCRWSGVERKEKEEEEKRKWMATTTQPGIRPPPSRKKSKARKVL